MTYGLFSLDSATAIAWFATEEEAAEAVVRIVETEPEAVHNLGMTLFDDRGAPADSLMGDELVEAAREIVRERVAA